MPINAWLPNGPIVAHRMIYGSSRLAAGPSAPIVPFFINKARRHYQWMDIYNALGRERTLFVSRYIDDEASNQVTIQYKFVWSIES